MAGVNQPRPKHTLWHRLIHNQWVVFSFMGIIALGMIGGTVCSASMGNQTGSVDLAEQRIDEQQEATGTAAAGATTASGTALASPTSTVQRRFSAPPEMSIDPEKQYFATLATDKGNIRIQLFPKEAPQSVNNFVFLARNDFYDGLTFHRVLDGFVAQGGDPQGNGTGGPGYTLPRERNDLRHEAGALAMAASAQGVSGSQFYITLAPQPSLDGNYQVFGKVVSGQEIVQALTKRDPDKNARAAPGDKILDITIEER